MTDIYIQFECAHYTGDIRTHPRNRYKHASADGTPIMRPLFYDFHNDSISQGIEDQQMFGPDYLVAPVLVKGASSRCHTFSQSSPNSQSHQTTLYDD